MGDRDGELGVWGDGGVREEKGFEGFMGESSEVSNLELFLV